MAIVEKRNGAIQLPVVSGGKHVVRRERGRAEELGVHGQRANGNAVAVEAKVVKRKVRRDEWIRGAVGQGRVAAVSIIITGLRLAEADLRQLGVAVDRLIAAGAKQHFWLSGERQDCSNNPKPSGAPLPREIRLVGAPVDG